MNLGVWETAFAAAVGDFVRNYLPNIAAAVGLVLAGWIVALVARVAVARVFGGGLALLARRPAVGRALARTQLSPRLIAVLARVVFWLVLLLFVAAAIERLQLTIAAALVSAFVAFLPRVVVALVIMFAGIVAGQVAFSAISRGASAARLPQAHLLARAVQMMIVGVAALTAADQVGIQSTLLTVVVATAVAATLGGASLAFGLGSRVAVSNIIGMFYLLKTYRVGQVVRIGDIEGEIVEVTQTGVFIAAPSGRVLVPGRRFSEEPSVLVAGGRS
jgi:small-conductance mechanosensitive channel